MTNVGPAATPESSPYHDAQLIDIGVLERAERNVTSWRRAFFCACIALMVALTVVAVLATKDHVEALVYKEDTAGDIALMGATSANHTPSNAAVVHQLTQWIQDVRDIPDDPDVVDRNATSVLSMTAANSPALDAYREFILADNPKKLAKEGYRRSVGSVEVDQLTQNTYRIAWTESLSRDGSNKRKTSYSGAVTLAQDPEVPNDPLVGQDNPAGVIIESYEMRWSVLR
jgi:type IV secretory pathway TrbF-like protein